MNDDEFATEPEKSGCFYWQSSAGRGKTRSATMITVPGREKSEKHDRPEAVTDFHLQCCYETRLDERLAQQ
ncbi:hypothetical protein V2K57_09975 [Pseudomonas alliivorans]|nr:hypothetical protein [Pseudomonas alliivorans]MEE4680212.1 hypothetical protein [Pseudomonas alliivorans]MEE4690408.1 hypothetical protein [Pseudomonas alliivorans]MEE4700728.1 hypothetical protein [Pseudomonas alliivorans]MEE4712529.1 hypothetical protein [Pseudomonas alliivorans]